MSSEEEEPTSPVLPKDSDRGSSVSSEFQDEYEELLRHAVVTSKLDAFTGAKLKQPSTSHLCAEGPSHQNPEYQDGRHSRRGMRSPRASPLIVEPSPDLNASHAEKMEGQSSGRASALSDAPSDRLHVASERSRPSSPDPLEFAVSEMFISDANISKMESILDTWSNKLKSNVLTELRKWKFAFMEQHKQEMMKERTKHEAQTAALKSELDSLKGLLHTYETSNQRKDEVIANLCHVLERQKEKLEKMRTFTHWRLQHSEVKEEVHASQVARQHYRLQLKKKVWLGWRSLIQRHWKDQVEKACRLRAQEVCTNLSADYEAKLAEHCDAIERAQTEIHRLRIERERYEDSMKKAFMRGVCALNMEALSIFHSAEGRQEQPPVTHQHDPLTSRDEHVSASAAHLQQPYPSTSTRYSPVHLEHPEPDEADEVSSGAHMSREDVVPPSMVTHTSMSLGGIASSHKQVSGRVATSSQQKPSKTVTARIAARADVSKSARSNLNVMGVAPPMSSVTVERHHPVTQLTVGQATAAKFPRSSQHTTTGARGSSSRAHSSTCQVHSLKVVE
ncbi:unnamed protein product [Ophioblennius macclurei]